MLELPLSVTSRSRLLAGMGCRICFIIVFQCFKPKLISVEWLKDGNTKQNKLELATHIRINHKELLGIWGKQLIPAFVSSHRLSPSWMVPSALIFAESKL